MDQYLSTIIITLITGVFSIITLIIQKKQDRVISKIDEQTGFIEREKTLKQKLTKKEKEKELLIHEIMILILDTNLNILEATNDVGEEVFAKSEELKKKFSTLLDEMDELNKEYDMVLELTSEFQRKINTKL